VLLIVVKNPVVSISYACKWEKRLPWTRIAAQVDSFPCDADRLLLESLQLPAVTGVEYERTMLSELQPLSKDLVPTKPVPIDCLTPSLPPQRYIAAGTQLFEEGAPRRHVYRIEHGTVAVYAKHVGRPNRVTSVAGPGEYVGLGCLADYSENARTVEPTILTSLELEAFNRLTQNDPVVRALQTEAIHKEFDKRKAMIVNQRSSTPAECVAAFLVAVSGLNVREGYDPSIVPDTCECGAVANLLGLDIETLAKALLSLKGQGLIHEAPGGELRLVDLGPLERMAEGLDPFVSAALVHDTVTEARQA
jgi:CRP/FNR family transcriptional regulator, anaerobic regulatory protein